MEIMSEREAEDFLEKNGFDVVNRVWLSKEYELKEAVEKLGFPLVMKVSGSKILHKNRVGGIRTKIENYDQAIIAFNELMKIKDAEGAMLQKQISGREFLLGVKNTPEFGQVIAFGLGGTKVEEMKKVAFRVAPFDKNEAKELIKEVVNDSEEDIENNLLRLCKLLKKYPNITELDINPLMVNQDAIVADARISFG
jgi:acyl-CoA synthetase (NDP forming)